MGKSYVHEYAGHAFKQFFSLDLPSEMQAADILNLEAVKIAMEQLAQPEVDTLRLVFTSERKTLKESVKEAAQIERMKEREIWRLVRRATNLFAEARVL